jgi:hypothetical protein
MDQMGAKSWRRVREEDKNESKKCRFCFSDVLCLTFVPEFTGTEPQKTKVVATNVRKKPML